MMAAERGGQVSCTTLLDFEIDEEDDLQGYYYLASRACAFMCGANLSRGFRIRRWWECRKQVELLLPGYSIS